MRWDERLSRIIAGGRKGKSFPKFFERKRAVTNKDLDEVEARLGFTFPPDLRQHYLKINGGVPYPGCCVRGHEVYKVEDFFPVKYGSPGMQFEDVYADLVLDNPEFPKNLVPIASDPGGEFFCYSVAKPTLGAIYCTSADDYSVPDQGPVRLAPNLDDFLINLVHDPEDD